MRADRSLLGSFAGLASQRARCLQCARWCSELLKVSPNPLLWLAVVMTAFVTASLILSVLWRFAESKRRSEEAPQKKVPRIGLSFDTLKEERRQRDRTAFCHARKELGAEVIDLAGNLVRRPADAR